MTNPALLAFAQQYASIPIPNLQALDEGINLLESELQADDPNYDQLSLMIDGLTDSMGFRASSADVCDSFLATHGDQLERILDIVGQKNTTHAFPILRELVRGAYAASVFTRMSFDPRDSNTPYARLEACRNCTSPEDKTYEEFRGVLREIVQDCKRMERKVE